MSVIEKQVLIATIPCPVHIYIYRLYK